MVSGAVMQYLHHGSLLLSPGLEVLGEALGHLAWAWAWHVPRAKLGRP